MWKAAKGATLVTGFDETRSKRPSMNPGGVRVVGGGPGSPRDDSNPEALLKAVRLQNVGRVRHLLESGHPADGNMLEEHPSLTPLVAACKMGATIIAQLLLAHGAKVNLSAAGGVLPLHAAGGAGAEACARLLLNAGADPAEPSDDGRRALHHAAAKGAAKRGTRAGFELLAAFVRVVRLCLGSPLRVPPKRRLEKFAGASARSSTRARTRRSRPPTASCRYTRSARRSSPRSPRCPSRSDRAAWRSRTTRPPRAAGVRSLSLSLSLSRRDDARLG